MYMKNELKILGKNGNLYSLEEYLKLQGNTYHYAVGIIEGLLECDVVYFAPGWVDSKGCNLEYAAAKIYGKTIYT